MVKVYTRTGDDGTTHCYKAGRISKSDIQISAVGTVDEVNSYTGLLSSSLESDRFSDEVTFRSQIQNRLFDLGGALATMHVKDQFEELIARIDEKPLEEKIDRMDQQLEPIKQFILPGGTLAASQAHVCRSVCRRAEREVVAMIEASDVSGEVRNGLSQVVQYLNRLSDFFFVLARYINKLENNDDVFWSKT